MTDTQAETKAGPQAASDKPNDAPRPARKVYLGKVKSDKMDKTITVVVDRLVKHPVYEKFIKRRTKMHAHDEQNDARIGDTVEIVATRPLSKLKRFRLLRVVNRAIQD